MILVAHVGSGTTGERVCRPSPLGNPFSHRPSRFEVVEVGSRAEAIARYRTWLRARLGDPGSPQSREVARLLALYRARGALTLLCYCAPLPCHAEVVREVLLEFLSAPDPGQWPTDPERSDDDGEEDEAPDHFPLPRDDRAG